MAKVGWYQGTLCIAHSVLSSNCWIYLPSIDFSFGWKCSTVTGGQRRWMQECVADTEGLWTEILEVFVFSGHWPGWSKKKNLCKVETFVISKVIPTPWIMERKCRPVWYGCLVGLLFHLPICLLTTWLDSTNFSWGFWNYYMLWEGEMPLFFPILSWCVKDKKQFDHVPSSDQFFRELQPWLACPDTIGPDCQLTLSRGWGSSDKKRKFSVQTNE